MSGYRFLLLNFSLFLTFNSFTQTYHGLQPGREIAIGTLGLGSLAVSHFVIKEKPLDTLVFLDVSRINGFDRIALDRWSIPAHTTSDVLMFGSVAISLAGGVINQNGQDLEIPIALVLESMLVNSGITSLVKNWVARPRPYTYGIHLPPGQRPRNGNLVSFWSGHTSTASSATMATAFMVQRSPASQDTKTITWIAAAGLPLAVGYYRVKAGRHFPTDVLVGYFFGALVGWAVPYFHRNEGT